MTETIKFTDLPEVAAPADIDAVAAVVEEGISRKVSLRDMPFGKWYNSLAELKNAVGHVAGDYAQFPRNGVVTTVLAKATTTPDEYGLIASTGSPAIDWEVQAGENGYNVKSFGAVGDGVTDDTASINSVTQGVRVDLAGGVYAIETDVTISGHYSNGTLLLKNTAKIIAADSITLNCKVLLDDSHRGYWMEADGIDGVHFGADFEYDGNDSGIGTITTIADKSEADIKNCTRITAIGAYFHDSNGSPLRITDSTRITIANCRAEDLIGLNTYGGNGIQTSAFARLQRCEYIAIVGNEGRNIDDNVFAGIGVRHMLMTGNNFHDVRFLTILHEGAAYEMEDVVVSGNVTTGCQDGFILGWWDGSRGYECKNVTISGNIFHSSATPAGTAWGKNYGFRVRYTTENCVISGNQFRSDFSCVAADSSIEANLPAGGFHDNLLTGNVFIAGEGGTTSPLIINESDGGDNNTYVGNDIRSLQYVSGSVQPVQTGTNATFKSNKVYAPAGYLDSIFKAGSVVRGNTFDTRGVLAGNAQYELIDNDFINGADINETGTAVKISGNRGTTNNQILVNNRKILEGAGSPEGVVTALIGSQYIRRDGGAGTSFYVKESGTGNTGWMAK